MSFNTRPLVILASPVRLEPQILREALYELARLETDKVRLEYWFYDDNDTEESSQLLKNFRTIEGVEPFILPDLGLETQTRAQTENGSHEWNAKLLDRIIRIKNTILARFLTTDADALFFVDSDICLHPKTIEHLYSLDLPIVSEVFWTQWKKDTPLMPNVWDIQGNKFRSAQSILQLREPGQYEVGGLGACTLIRRAPISAGVNFSWIRSLDIWGEDRHFCVRATCLGFPLYADTVFPPFHIYRESQLVNIQGWRTGHYDASFFRNQLGAKWERDIVTRQKRLERAAKSPSFGKPIKRFFKKIIG